MSNKSASSLPVCVHCFIVNCVCVVLTCFNRCLCSAAEGRKPMAEGPLVCEESKLDGGHTVSPDQKNDPLDYRQKGDVMCSKRDSQGRFVNPWPTWQFPSYSTILRLFLMEKNNSNVPSAKEVSTRFTMQC